MTIKVGCNAGVWPAVNSAVPGVLTCRSYRDTVNDIPTVWPGITGVTATTVSLKPDPVALLANTPVPDNGSGFTTLFDQIRYLAQQAPSHSKLTVWHEAGNLYLNNPAITPQNIRSSHVSGHNACAGTNVNYGCIIYGTIADMDKWIPKVPYAMDWYGIDMYDNTNSNNGGSFRNQDGTISASAVSAYLDQYRTLAQGRTGLQSPQIDVCECNCPEARKWARGPFFTDIAAWLFRSGGTRMEVFYLTGGPDSGSWLPDDQPTIDALNAIVANYG